MKKNIFCLVISFLAFSSVNAVSVQDTKCQLWQWNIALKLVDASGKKYEVSPYLWIPPTCKKITAVLFASTATIEQAIVESPEIRAVCRKYNIAIVWSDTQFYHDEATGLKQILEILTDFANLSGYGELTTAPWIPVGHSATLKMIRDMAKLKMEKLAFMIMNKNNNSFGYSSAVPVLTTYGEFVEWDSYDIDLKAIVTKEKSYPNVVKARAEDQLLVSYFFDPNTGHFDCSKPLMNNIARWMDNICAIRFDSNGNLRKVSPEKGWICQPPVPGFAGFPPKKFSETSDTERKNAWFPTYETAMSAYTMANISMKRKAQLAGFADAEGNYENGWWRAVMYNLPYILNNDGTMKINSTPYTRMPQGIYANKFTDDKTSPDYGRLYSFINKNDTFENSGNLLEVEVLCGNLKKVDNHTFEYIPRFNSPSYIVVREAGNAEFRSSVQPGRLNFKEITEGEENSITFPLLPDQQLNHLLPLPLKAEATSGLRVKYFIKSGAAHIDEQNRLIIKPENIPPRTKFPYTISVTAYQLGSGEKGIRTAKSINHTFLILK